MFFLTGNMEDSSTYSSPPPLRNQVSWMVEITANFDTVKSDVETF